MQWRRTGGYVGNIAQLIDEMIERDTLGFADGMCAAVFYQSDSFGFIPGTHEAAPTVMCPLSCGRGCAVPHDAIRHKRFELALGPSGDEREFFGARARRCAVLRHYFPEGEGRIRGTPPR